MAGADFEATFNYFMTYGYVFMTPDYFLMAEEGFLPEYGPMWFVWYASTEDTVALAALLRLTPYELPYIGFSRALRKNPEKIRVYRTDRLRKLLNHYETSKQLR